MHQHLCYDDSAGEFYAELQSLVYQTPKQNILVVQGDWNAKAEIDTCEDFGGGGRGAVCGT